MPDTVFESEYQRLNKSQKQAVDQIYGPLLVVAGPGSGKTQILSLRAANILRQTDAMPSNILCLTFTDSAAINMRKRLGTIIGQDAFRVAIHTFHNFGLDIINRHAEYFFNASQLKPADAVMQFELLSGVFKKLSFDDPLNKIGFDGSFSHLKAAQKAIASLKAAGLLPEEFLSIIRHNQEIYGELQPLFDSVFGQTITKKTLPACVKLQKSLEAYRQKTKFPSDQFKSVAELIVQTFSEAVAKAGLEDTKPVTAWKNAWLAKDEHKQIRFKDWMNFPRLESLANVYGQYRKALQENGYLDFDDMLIETIQTVKKNKTLRYELQEQYQFIMVDEFQDTNDAQMRLLDMIARSDISPNEPNLMAVGDDDQAIYKFQGAELSNILDFKQRYNAKVIALLENYRSTDAILGLAKTIIRQGEDRLETRIKDLDKNLQAVNPKKLRGEILFRRFPTDAHEYAWIARRIQELVKTGEVPSEIAVIAREHKILQAVARNLQERGIPVVYERQRNVLLEPHIVQLITMARFLDSLASDKHAEADELLPEILSYPFWGLERIAVWRIAHTAKISWLETMLGSENGRMRDIAHFLIELGVRAKSEPLERVLDSLIGTTTLVAEENDDNASEPESRRLAEFQSPFRQYYFSKERFKEDPQEYILFLSALRVFYGSLREYKQGEVLKLHDLIEFIETRKAQNIPLPDQTPFVDSQNAVTLLTAHKAKGQEFDSVFIASCQENIWAGRKFASALAFPKNLPIAPAGDERDDQLRLFYVALTRARKNLYLSSYETNEQGDESLPLNFIGEEFMRTERARDQFSDEEIVQAISSPILMRHAPPYAGSEKALLEQYLREYRLSPTHLNNFLDLSAGGPQNFVEQNLLHFPQAKSASGAFGTAVHKAIENINAYLKTKNTLPETGKVLEWFEASLSEQRLGEDEHKQFLAKGKHYLERYFERTKGSFKPDDMAEVNFRNRGAILGAALLNGKIDRIAKLGNDEYALFDIKTGKPLPDWQGHDAYEKIKAWKYRNQLGFYNILMASAPEFAKSKVKKSALEFVEAGENDAPELVFDMDKQFIERLGKLAQIVYTKIMALDFPDTSKYEQNINGTLAFEEDLLKQEDKLS